MERRTLVWALLIFPVILLAAGLLSDSPAGIMGGLGRIITSPSILLHDYLALGGLGATLVNAGLCGLISCLLVILLKIDINGPFIAAVYTVIGFAFFGKNVANIWPIFAGVWLFSQAQGVPFRNYLLVALFGTTLAPLGSALAFGTFLNAWQGLTAGIFFGLAAGFVLPPLASHMLRFHDGYNIYNIGFTGGIIGSFITAILRSFEFTITPVSILSDEYDLILKALFMGFFGFMILSGFIFDRRGEQVLGQQLAKIHRSSGRLVSDFTQIADHPSAIVNMGIMGFVASLFVMLLGGSFNGPVVGGILTVVGFAAFGKHTKNCIPVLAGVYIASLFKIWGNAGTGLIIAGLFGTTLAPIAGQYGPLAGIAAGFFHLSIVMNVGVLHGGVNLYNNGFAGGFVASFLVPVFDALKREKKL